MALNIQIKKKKEIKRRLENVHHKDIFKHICNEERYEEVTQGKLSKTQCYVEKQLKSDMSYTHPCNNNINDDNSHSDRS